MRSDVLRQFTFHKGVMRCPECTARIVVTNLDQAVKAAGRHVKRHAEANMNLINSFYSPEYMGGVVDGSTGIGFERMSGPGMRRSVDGATPE